MSDESVLEQLKSEGVRFYGKTVVSPFSTKDSGHKMQLINFLIEKCGYTLSDGRGFPEAVKVEATE